MIKKRGDYDYEAELRRLKGELLLRQDHSNAAEAQSSFERAIEIPPKAKRQVVGTARHDEPRPAAR